MNGEPADAGCGDDTERPVTYMGPQVEPEYDVIDLGSL